MPRRKKVQSVPILKEINDLELREDELTEDEFYRLEVLRGERDNQIFEAIPTLTCCEAAKNYHAVRFTVDVYGSKGTPTTGYWHVPESEVLGRHRRACNENWHKEPVPAVRFCPFCGVATPRMRMKKALPPDLMRCSDGGDYCDTCCERLRECRCLPPEAAFEPDV